MTQTERRTRPDRVMEAMVFERVAMAAVRPRSDAAGFMLRKNVPLSVIGRVLAKEPGPRRPMRAPPSVENSE